VIRWMAQPDADAGYTITWFDPKNKAATFGSMVVPAGTTSYEIIGLLPGTKYTYTIQANNTVKGASPALKKSVTTTKFVAPKAARAVTGDVGLTSVKIRWQPQPQADAGYTITWLDPKNRNVILGSVTVPAGTTQYEITGLQPGTKYTYVIQAVNSTTAVLSAKLTVSVTTAKFTAPKLTKIAANDIDADSVTLRWQPLAGADKFIVTYAAKGKSPVTLTFGPADNTNYTTDANGNIVSVTITGLTADTKYDFTVQGVIAAVNAKSAPTKTTTTTLKTPRVKAAAPAQATALSALLSWEPLTLPKDVAALSVDVLQSSSSILQFRR